MASSSSPFLGIGMDTLNMLKEKMKKYTGDDGGKFLRMCDSEAGSHGFNLLHLAAIMDAIDVCKLLVDRVGVDINVIATLGGTPLMMAVEAGHVAIVEYLIERGADITAADDKGFTALHSALVKANKEFVIMLLKNGADINADSVGGTPLHFAAKSGNADIMKILIQNNAEPNSISTYTGFSPLLDAIFSRKVECVEILLKARADANKFACGLSPLAFAIQIRSNCCIEALLAAGADVDSVSSYNLRPIEHAARTGNLEAVWILILARPRLMATPNWSLINLLNGLTAVQTNQKIDLYARNFEQKADDAWDEQDYSSAIASYTEAMHYNPEDEKLLANRSLCWARMGEAVFALKDAETCVGLKPEWAKAHLRTANALHLLKRYRMSSDTFKMAFELDPDNEEIERWDAL